MLDHDSPVPLHTQLADLLRGKIAKGEITGRVPSIVTAAQEYKVYADLLVMPMSGVLLQVRCAFWFSGSA